MARTYLILFNELPIERALVKRGENPPQVVTATRCVNVALFLSNALRRDVTLSVGIVDGDEWKVISFPGESLRRVSPDERSTSFFLLKAVEALESLLPGTSRTMDNGMTIRRTTYEEFLEPFMKTIYLSTIDGQYPVKLDRTEDSIFIYDIDMGIITERPEFTTILRPITPERFILDINMIYDSIE